MAIEHALVTILKTDAALAALVSTDGKLRVFDSDAPQEGELGAFPRIVYEVLSSGAAQSHDGDDGAPVMEVDFDCQSYDKAESRDLADKVATRLREYDTYGPYTVEGISIHSIDTGEPADLERDETDPPESAGEVPLRHRIVPALVRYYR